MVLAWKAAASDDAEYGFSLMVSVYLSNLLENTYVFVLFSNKIKNNHKNKNYKKSQIKNTSN